MRLGPDESPNAARGRPAIGRFATLGIELRRMRESLPGRVTQADMAKLLGVAAYTQDGKVVSTPRAYISLWENGHRIPPADVIARYRDLDTADPDLLDKLVVAAEADSRPPSVDDVDVSDTGGEHTTDRAPDPPPVEPGHDTDDPPTRSTGRRRHRYALAWASALLATATVFAGGYWAGHHVGSSAAHDANPPPKVHRANGSSPTGSAARTLPPVTFTETTGTPAHVWSDFRTATGGRGTPLQPRQSLQVSCRVRGYTVQDGDPWWYRLESSPWNGHYYATSDAFYNNGSDHGPVDNGVIVDEQVPLC